MNALTSSFRFAAALLLVTAPARGAVTAPATAPYSGSDLVVVGADGQDPPPGTERVAREAARAAAEAARAAKESTRELHQQWGEGKGESFTDKLAKVVKVGEGATVVVQNFSGNITVSAGPAGEVRVQATKRTRGGSSDEAKRQLDSTRVSIEERMGRVEIKAWSQWGPGRVAVDFDVTVPATSALDLKSVNGDIAMTGVKGAVTAETVSGDVTAAALASDASLRTVSGDVQVSGSSVAGEVTAQSVSGDVTARTIKARAVRAGTVSGNVALQDASCDRASVNSVSGNVEIAGPLAKSARYELKSHSGDVRVVLDGKTGFEVDASTWSGGISSELTIKARPADEPNSGRRNKTLRGVFGDGSAQIEVTSFSGNVTIVKAK